MRLSTIRCCLSGMLFCIASVQAAEPITFETDTNTTASTLDPDEVDPGYRILLQETSLCVAETGLSTTRIHRQIMVEQAKAIELVGDVNVPYNSYREDAHVVAAFTRGPDGKSLPLDRAAIHDKVPEDVAGLPMYTDARTISFAMPAVVAGAVIDYDVEIREKTSIMPQDFFAVHFFDANVPVSTSRFVAIFPKSRTVTLSPQALTTTIPTDITNATERMLVWELRDVRPLRYENGMPAAADLRPCIRLTSLHTWTDIAKWYQGLLENPMREDATVSALARTLTAGMSDDLDKARALYRYVSRDIRYVGLELGRSAYEPHAIGQTLQNRYGDCKDKAALLSAMLQAVGIQAQVALVKPNFFGRIVRDQPSPAAFNHAIVHVPRASGDWWIDATVPLADVPEYDTSLDGVDALIPGATEATQALVQLPVLDERHSIHRHVFDVDVRIGGFCTVQETEEYAGRAAIPKRIIFNKLDRAKFYERLKHNWDDLENYARLLSVEYSDATNETRSLQITTRYETDNFLTRAAGGFQLAVANAAEQDWLVLPREAASNTRRHPRLHAWISRSAHTEETVYRLHLIDGLRIGHAPAALHREFKHGSLDLTFEDTAVPTLLVRAIRKPAQLEPDELSAESANVERALARAKISIGVEDSINDLLGERDYVAAEKQLAEAAASHPASADAQLRLSQFYISAGRSWRAARAAEQAITDAPADHRGYEQSAACHTGVFGAPGPGFDRTAIDSIWSRALTQVPLQSWVQKQIALYATFDDRGERGTTNAPLSKAQEIYLACLKSKPRSFQSLTGLGDIYRFTGKYDEAEQMYRKALEIQPTAPSAASGIWVSHAFDGREDDAYAAITAYYRQDSQKIQAEASRVCTLLFLDRRYTEAAALYERIADEAQQPDRVHTYLQFLRKLAKAKQVDYATYFDDRSPDGAARTAFAALTTMNTNLLRQITTTELTTYLTADNRLARLHLSSPPNAKPAVVLFGLDCVAHTYESHTRDLTGGDVALVLEPPSALSVNKDPIKVSPHFQVTHEANGWRIYSISDPKLDAMFFAQRALQYLQQGDITNALAWQSRLPDLNNNPKATRTLSDITFANDTSRIQAWIGAAFLALGSASEQTQGLNLMLAAAIANPDNVKLSALTCIALARRDHTAEALARAQTIKPDKLTDASLLTSLCELLCEAENYDLAAQYLARLKEIDPNSTFASNFEVALLLHRGKPEEARIVADKFAQPSTRARQAIAHTQILLALYAHDQKAMRTLAETNRQADTPAILRHKLAASLNHIGLFAEAREQVTLAMVAGDKSADMMILAAEISLHEGCAPEALDFLQRAQILGLPDPEQKLSYAHGLLLAELGQHAEAATILSGINTAQSARMEAYHRMISATEQLRAGKTREADQALNLILEMDGDEIWAKLAARLFLGKATAEDLQAYIKGIKSPLSRNDRTCEMNYILGTAQELTGKIDAARAAYDACVATQAGQNYEYWLARASLQRLGETR